MNKQKGKEIEQVRHKVDEINQILKNFSIVFSGAIIEMKDGKTIEIDNDKLEQFIELNTWKLEGDI